MMNETKSMPMVALRGMAVIPEMLIHFDVSRSRSVEAVQRVMRSKEQQIFLVAQRELGVEEPEQKDVIMEAYNQMMAKAAAYVPNEVGPINVQDMIDMMSYIGVGFILNYEQTLEQIMELNPDAEVILVVKTKK